MSTSNTIQCDEWEINYSKVGQGPALILLHGGLPGSSGESAYSQNIDYLAQYFTLYIIDFPGWGKSSKNLIPKGQWGDPMAAGGKVIISFMKSLGIQHAHLMGGSFGASAALHAAMIEPEMIGQMVLMAPGGGVATTTSFPWPALIELITYYGNEKPTYEKFESLASYMVFDKKSLTQQWMNEQYESSLNPEIIENPPLRLPPGFIPDPTMVLSNDNRLKNLKSKVLIIWGLNDQMQPIDCLESFGSIPEQQIVILEQCGHWPHKEHPEQVHEAVLNFFNPLV